MSCGSDGDLSAKPAFRSMNAAEFVRHRPQQMPTVLGPYVGPDHRKFHCVFKDSGAK
jgi:hypothetical protein